MLSYPSILEINGRTYKINYQCSFKTTSTVRIKNGSVHLKISRFAKGKARYEIVERFLKWAQRRLSKVSSDFLTAQYKNGGRVWTHNKIYELEVFFMDQKRTNSQLWGNVIKMFIPSDKSKFEDILVKNLAEEMIMRDQSSYLTEVIEELNQLYFKENYSNCRFKRMNSRFGSCSSKRNINVAYRLLFAPRQVFRYVCIHELAHLKEMNHSKRFWQLVKMAMPDYKEPERWLRNNGFMLG